MRQSYYNLRGDDTSMSYDFIRGMETLGSNPVRQAREEEEAYFRRHDQYFNDRRELDNELKRRSAAQNQRGRISSEPNILDRYAGKKSWRDMNRHERHKAEREADRQLRQAQAEIRGFEDDRPTNTMMKFNQDEFKTQVGGAMEKYFKENPGVMFNGLWVNKEGVGICDWDAPNTELVKRFIESVGGAYDEIVEVEKVL